MKNQERMKTPPPSLRPDWLIEFHHPGSCERYSLKTMYVFMNQNDKK